MGGGLRMRENSFPTATQWVYGKDEIWTRNFLIGSSDCSHYATPASIVIPPFLHCYSVFVSGIVQFCLYPCFPLNDASTMSCCWEVKSWTPDSIFSHGYKVLDHKRALGPLPAAFLWLAPDHLSVINWYSVLLACNIMQVHLKVAEM